MRLFQNHISFVNNVQSLIIIAHHLVTSLLISVHFQAFCKSYCCKTKKAILMKKVPNESKLIEAITMFSNGSSFKININ